MTVALVTYEIRIRSEYNVRERKQRSLANCRQVPVPATDEIRVEYSIPLIHPRFLPTEN